MFYSHNLLARKGPLGTVWCAAHLQNRLKKSNYITINIPSTVEQIMNPQVPIALRMSGHLLLGVVRIYSKKVEYLHHDYNVLSIDICKAYAHADINLPQDANQAKFESITLPDNFALDLMDIDDYNPNESPDSHLRLNKDISIIDRTPPASISKRRDRTPAGYIRISVGENVYCTPSYSVDNSGAGSIPVVENSVPLTPPPIDNDFRDPVADPIHNNEIGSDDNFIDGYNIPSYEQNRDSTTIATPLLPDRVEPDIALIDELTKGKSNISSNFDEIVDDARPSSPPMQTPPQKSVLSEPEAEPVQDKLGPDVSFGLAPSPSVVEPALVAEQPRVKRRRIKYDKATVLSNEFMKKSIDDASDLKRNRKGVSSLLGVWKLNNTYKKEKVLSDPLITGLQDNLCQMNEDGYVSSKPHLIITEQENLDAMEIERSSIIENNMIQIHSPGNSYFSSPRPVDENTPAIHTDMGSKSYQFQTTVGTAIDTDMGSKSYQFQTTVGSTPDPTSSIGSFLSDGETPQFFQSHQGFENSGGLSGIPEGDDDAGQLACLEEDEGATSLQGTPNAAYSSGQQKPPPETGSLLPKTRAVAQYIKEKSTATPSTSDNVGSVSMKNILEGKTRKLCSRFFFETLVLKSCDYIDVKQDTPYGDITLKVTPKLSKLEFSN